MKRFLSRTLLATMVVAMLPAAAFAQESPPLPGDAPTTSQESPVPPEAATDVAADVAPDGAAARVLGLADVMELALKNNPKILKARSGILESEAELESANAEMQPRIEVVGSIAPMTGHGLPSADDPFHAIGSKDFGQLDEWGVWLRLNVKLYQPIYTSGKITWLRRARELGVKVERAREDIAVADVRQEVWQAWMGLILTRQLTSVLSEGRGYFDKAREHLKKLEDADDPSFDPVDNMKVNVYEAQIIERELQAKRMMNLAEGLLRRLIGDDPLSGATFAVDATIEPLPFDESLDLDTLVQSALVNRVEINALRMGIKAREAEVEARFRNFFPDFLVYAEFNAAYSNVTEPLTFPYYDPYNDLTLGAGLVMRFDLNIGKKLGELKLAKAKKSGLGLELDAAENSIRLEISKLYMELNDARTMMETRHNALKAARGWVIAKTDLFENDLCGLQDIIDGLTQFFLAQLSYYQSIYDYNVAVAALERATGTEMVAVSAPDMAQ